MTTEYLKIRAIRAEQGDGVPVYTFFLRGADIFQIADVSRIHRDDQDELKGFQRKEIKAHVGGIVEYLDRGNVLFPNALILAFLPEIEFKQSRGPSPDGAVSGNLTIPIYADSRRPAWIVDGQQRSFALDKSKNRDIMVPVVGFVASRVEVQREQFILVNKAKPLPRRLIIELLPEIDATLPADLRPARIPSEICNLLARDPKSPFFRLIRRASDEGVNPQAVVEINALIKVMKDSINKYGALALFKNASEGRSDIDSMYQVMCIYWEAVKEVFPEAWAKSPQESRLMHSAGIQAMGILMDRIMPRVYGSQDVKQDVKEALSKIAPHCCWTEGTWEGLGLAWNDVQSVERHIRAIAELLVKLDFAATQEVV